MCANKNNNSVTKLGEINGKKIQVTQWRNSFLLNYNSNALNLQFDPFTLTKLGLYPDKSQVNDDSKYMDSKRFNLFIPFDDLSEENLQKLRELDIFFKTNAQFKKDCQLSDNAKYNSILNDMNGYINVKLNQEYMTENVTTTFINKDDTKDITKNAELNQVREYFTLGSTLQMIVTGSVYRYTSSKNNELYYGVNLKLVTCKYSKSNKVLSAEEESMNANLFFENKTRNVEEIDLLDFDSKNLTASTTVNKSTGKSIPVLSVNNKEQVHIRFPELVLTPSIYGLPAGRKIKEMRRTKCLL
jgi:hypothetical protein